MMSHFLNPEQKIAVEHLEGPLLVLAGAGSGKTRIITHRIAHLLSLGVPAEEILAVTFTNKAAEEMRYRIKQLSSKQILTCTFHSLAATILRESIHLIGYKNSFSIYDEEDSLHLLKTILKSQDYPDDKSHVRSIKHAISEAKNDLKGPSEISASFMDRKEFEEFKTVYLLYQQKLKEYNACDFDDLLFLCVQLLKTSQEARDFYQSKWSFILIDEYQDTNEAQYTLARLLVSKHQNLFVVGDPDQSIYSWRGANIKNILDFENDFKNAKVIKLEQNYRSTSHILYAANSLIQHNKNRYEKNLWSSLGEGEKVQVYIHDSENDEARHVIKKIESHHNASLSYDKMVIFYRTNAQSRVFEDYLLREKIPYTIVGGISFYQRKEIKDLLSYLRSSLTETDFLSFSRTINLPKRGIGPQCLEKLKNGAECRSMSIISFCQQLIQSPVLSQECKLSTRQAESLKEYLDVLSFIKNAAAHLVPIKEILKTLIELSRYLDHLKEDKETYDDRKANIDELISKAFEWETENPGSSLGEFLEDLSLKTSTEDQKQHGPTVKLMTLHNGKGLEFDVAFIVGMEEELLPHINSRDSEDQLEEERRLCYVGMTRAKRHLYLSSASYRMLWGIPKTMKPSRFLEEIDSTYIEWHEKKKQTFSSFSKPFIEPKESFFSKEPSEEIFSAGCQVIHKDFGRGIVQKNYSTSLGITYDVYFPDSRSTKSLVAKFAKLKKA